MPLKLLFQGCCVPNIGTDEHGVMLFTEKLFFLVLKNINFVDDLPMIRTTLFSLVISLSVISPVAADFSCSSDIRYRWKAQNQNEGVQQPKKGAAPTATPETAEAAEPNGSDVFWGTVEGTSATEDEAKAKLTDLLNKERARADAACRDLHENQTRCIAGKYGQSAGVLSMMSFSQRKEFEKSIISDCENSSGKCLGSSISEVKCREVKSAVEATPAPEEKKGKDSKKK